MLYIKLFIEREKNIGQSAPECPFNITPNATLYGEIKSHELLCHINRSGPVFFRHTVVTLCAQIPRDL